MVADSTRLRGSIAHCFDSCSDLAIKIVAVIAETGWRVDPVDSTGLRCPLHSSLHFRWRSSPSYSVGQIGFEDFTADYGLVLLALGYLG